MSLELDTIDRLGASAFDGYLVRKDLVRRYSRQYPVPTYVVEFLLGRYCATVDEDEITEGLQVVERQLKDRTVRTGEEELFKAKARDKGSVKLIDLVRAKLDAKNDCYIAEVPSLALRDVRIDDTLVREHERMLTDGFVLDALGYAGDQASVVAQAAGDLTEGLRGDSHHDALRSFDGPGQVPLQDHLPWHLDARQKAIVAARLADFIHPLRDMPPERDLVASQVQQSRQGRPPRARAKYSNLH